MNSTEGIDGAPLWGTKTAIVIRKVWLSCILLLGTFGNVAIIVIMRRLKGNNPSQKFLTALAVVDQVLLCRGSVRYLVMDFLRLDVRDVHTVVCRVDTWLSYTCGTTSAWLVTAVTVQRMMAVKWPHKMRMVCTARRTRMTIAIILVTSGGLHFHWMLGRDVSENGCSAKSASYEEFHSGVWTWVDMCVSSVLPCVCLFGCNVVLSMTLNKALTEMTASVQAVSHADVQHRNSRRKTASKTTVMILTLSCAFLVLTLPVCVYILWENYFFDQILVDPELSSKADLAFTVTILLWYTNSAINFLLYCITGSRIRKEFFRWVCCRAAMDTPDSDGTSFRLESARCKQNTPEGNVTRF